MMEKIFISYRPVDGFRTAAFHVALNYIDRNGHHHVIDAGPEFAKKPIEAAGSTFVEEVFSKNENNKDSRFGRLILNSEDSPKIIKQKRATYQNNQILVPFAIVSKGKNLRSVWQKFSHTASLLDKKYEYRPLSQNSNTFISHILGRSGYKRPTQRPHNVPNEFTTEHETLTTDIGRVNVPGFNKSLKSPIKHNNEEPKLLPTPLNPPLTSGEVKPRAIYNPFNRDEEGKSDLLAEAHMMRDEPWLAKKLIRAAGREDFFKHFFEAA